MQKQQSYIRLRNPKTGEEKTLIEMIAEGNDPSLADEKYVVAGNLPDHIQYALFMGLVRQNNQYIVSKEELWDNYHSWAEKKGNFLMSRDEFTESILLRFPKVYEVFIGEKEYWFGIELKHVS